MATPPNERKDEKTGQFIGTHGMCGTPEYYAWDDMRRRCSDPNIKNYKNYGGRGISVCERWSYFENFLADMGKRPSSDHSLDRFPDNDGNYEPDNCRWATAKEQAFNRRKRKNCKRGHPLSGANLYVDPRGWGQCRICKKLRDKKFAAKQHLTNTECEHAI